MSTDINPKFSSRELESCQNWLLPDVTSAKTLPSAEKEALDRKRAQAAEKEKTDQANETIDTIEDYVAPMTADQLAAITEAAEKEGYEKGYQTGFEKGEAEGKDQGLETGKEEGLALGQQQVIEKCEQLQHLIDALMIPLENEQKQLESVLLNMVTQLAEAVVLRELKQDSSHITRLVNDAINVLPVGTDRFTLFLNAQDRQTIENHLEQHPKSAEYSVLIHQDNTLLPGGCRLETKQSIVDFSVEQRLATVIDGFLHKRYATHDDDEQQAHKTKDAVEKTSTKRTQEDDNTIAAAASTETFVAEQAVSDKTMDPIDNKEAAKDTTRENRDSEGETKE